MPHLKETEMRALYSNGFVWLNQPPRDAVLGDSRTGTGQVTQVKLLQPQV